MGHHLQDYMYDALEGPDSIRILRLHSTRDSLECTLQQIKYSDGGYQALSYVWGSQDTHHKIVVRDESGKNLGDIPLTENLRNAIRDLRDSDQIVTKMFWIDQISINQKGDEKNHQVALMGKIYENATRVVVYAGPAPADWQEEERGLVLMRLLNEHYAKNLEVLSDDMNIFEAQDRKAELPVQTIPNTSAFREITSGRFVSEGWRWLLQVVFGNWTERLWIVQELLLNKELWILRGLHLIPWDCIASISFIYLLDSTHSVSNIVKRFWRDNPPNATRVPADVIAHYFAIWNQRRWRKPGRPLLQDTLLGNMSWCEDSDCRDPRDRIYAMLAISKDAITLGIVPNYGEVYSTDCVFHDASVRILKAASNLDVLSYVCRWAKTETKSEGAVYALEPFPAPNPSSWALSACHRPFPDITNADGRPHPQTSLLDTVRFSHNDSVLVLKGSIVDDVSLPTPVTWMSAPSVVGVRDHSHFRRWSQHSRSRKAILEELGLTVESAASLCRAIVASPHWAPLMSDSLCSGSSYAFAFFLYCRYKADRARSVNWTKGSEFLRNPLEQHDQMVLDLAALLLDKSCLESFDPKADLTAGERECARDVRRRSWTHGRSLCVTRNGRVCNAMNQAEKGDVIAAFQGSTRLWVLRPVGKRYRLVGDAYVDGLMNGEIYEGLDSNVVDYDIELV